MSETVIEEAPPAAPQMPQIPLTDQERLIDEAMTSCGGKFNRVARRLKMNPKTLRGIILTSPHLSKTWADIEEPVSKEDVDMALKTEVEDEAVRKGVSAMGLTDETARLAVSLKRFQGTHYQSSLALISGGITKQFLQTLVDLDEIETRLKFLSEKRLSQDRDKKNDNMAEEVMLREDRVKLKIILNQFFNQSHNGALTLAKIKNLMKDGGENGGKRRAKPGFDVLRSANPNENSPE